MTAEEAMMNYLAIPQFDGCEKTFTEGYAKGRKEGIEDYKRMKCLERTGHTGEECACVLCAEYRQLKGKGK